MRKPGYKVLLLEDNPDFAQLFLDHLKDLNFEVKCVESVLQAKALFDAQRFDFLITDLHLKPESGDDTASGLSFIKYVRHRKKSNVPIAVTTGLDLVSKDQVLNCGANLIQFKTAEFNFAEFLQEIISYIEKT